MLAHKPNFFIVGAPKCGTTAMYEYLRQHPEIYMPYVKELLYFGTDLNILSPARNFDTVPRSEKDLAYYYSFFDSAGKINAIGEASVWYLYSINAAQEIKAFNPDAKVIIMLRNPVDFLHALHSQYLWDANEDIEDFMTALSAEPDRKQGRRIPATVQIRESLYYRETAQFHAQVRRYLELFGNEQVLVLIYEEFSDDPQSAYASVLNFLGVSTSFTPEFRLVNANKRVRSQFLRDILMQPSGLIKVAGKLIPSSLRGKLISQLRRLNTQYIPRPKLDPAVRSQLLQEFRPEIESLQELLQRDLSLWSSEAN